MRRLSLPIVLFCVGCLAESNTEPAPDMKSDSAADLPELLIGAYSVGQSNISSDSCADGVGSPLSLIQLNESYIEVSEQGADYLFLGGPVTWGVTMTRIDTDVAGAWDSGRTGLETWKSDDESQSCVLNLQRGLSGRIDGYGALGLVQTDDFQYVCSGPGTYPVSTRPCTRITTYRLSHLPTE